jgi:hypothetical protein
MEEWINSIFIALLMVLIGLFLSKKKWFPIINGFLVTMGGAWIIIAFTVIMISDITGCVP